MNTPGWRLRPLHGELEGHRSVDVSGNSRLTFAFEREDAVLVDITTIIEESYMRMHNPPHREASCEIIWVTCL